VIGYPADNAPTFAGGSVLGPEVLTQEYKINYLRPPGGETLVVRASLVSASTRQAVWRCDDRAAGPDGGEAFCAAAHGAIASVAVPTAA
jgi:acyl-coenzyme A thioesterase PaaI-like protein